VGNKYQTLAEDEMVAGVLRTNIPLWCVHTTLQTAVGCKTNGQWIDATMHTSLAYILCSLCNNFLQKTFRSYKVIQEHRRSLYWTQDNTLFCTIITDPLAEKSEGSTPTTRNIVVKYDHAPDSFGRVTSSDVFPQDPANSMFLPNLCKQSNVTGNPEGCNIAK
jgi:hypothetical protein